MAEFTSRIRLVGTDQTGEAFRSAAQNHERMLRSINQGAQQQQALFGRLAGGVAGLERRLTAATAAMGAGAFLRESLTDFAAMDRRLTRLAQNADVPRKKIDGLKKELNTMADEIGIGREGMLKGFETYVRQTGDFDKAKANIREIGEAAHAMNAEVSDVAQTARVLTQSMGIDPTQMAAAFDMIATAGNKGNFEAKNIAQSLPELGDAARAAGLSGKAGLAEMLAIMETISDKVKEPEQVMQAMRDIMSRMVQPELLNNFQKQSGISLQAMLNNARRNGTSMFATLVQTTEEATKRMAAAQNVPFERRHEMLGALFPELDSRRGMQALLNGGQRVVDVLNAIDDSAGQVKKQLGMVSRDTASDLQRLADEWEGLKQTIGGTLVSVGVLDGLKQMREEFEGISKAAAIVDQFMARYRTKGITGAVAASVGDAVRNKQTMNRRFELDAAEKRLAEFKEAKQRGMSEFSPSERYGGMGIPGLGFQAMPMPVDAGIEQAERDVAKAKLRIERAEAAQRRAGEIEERDDRGIRPTTDQRLKDAYAPRESFPEVIPPLPPQQRVMGQDTGVQPPQTREEQISGLERQRDAIAQGIVDGYSRMQPREPMGRPQGPIMPTPAPTPRAPDLSGRETRLPRGIVDPYAPPPGYVPPPPAAPAPQAPAPVAPPQPAASAEDREAYRQLRRRNSIFSPNDRDRAYGPETTPPAPPPPPAMPEPRVIIRREPADATVQRQSFDADDDKPWKGLIQRTAISADAEPTARGQQDQIEQTRQSNELLRQMLRRQMLPKEEGDDEGDERGANAGSGGGGGGSGGGGGGSGRAGEGASGRGGGSGGGGGREGGSAAGGAPARRGGGDHGAHGGDRHGGGGQRGGEAHGHNHPGETPGAGQTRSGKNVDPVDGVGGVDQRQGSVASHRKQAITDQLRSQLSEAGKEAGVNAEIFSGGQDEHGPNRTGSHRHDHGRSADVKLYRIGPDGKRRYLSMNNEADREVMEKFIKGTVKHGATGVGAGPGYMGDKGIHIGGGSPLAWGAGGRAANAPEWVRRAHREGMEERRKNPPVASRQGEPQASGEQTGGGEGQKRRGGLTNLIEREAERAGIDPRLMHGIRAGESGHRDDYDVKSDRVEDSHGPFQLNRRGGLGQEFEQETGKDVRDPRTIKDQARWVAEYIAKRRRRDPNWSPGKKWYGYKGLVPSDPRWGESGYKEDAPTKTAETKPSAQPQAEAPKKPEAAPQANKAAPAPAAAGKPEEVVLPEIEAPKPREFLKRNNAMRADRPAGEAPARRREPAAPAAPDMSAAREAVEAHRREMERPIRIRYETDGTSGSVGNRGPVQARREQEASARSARYSSYSDVGVA